MSNEEFENYMALLSRLLRLNGVQDKKIRDELRDHLEFRVADLVESGTDPNEAVRKALEEFGDAASLAKHFQSIFKSNKKRWVMRFATFSVAGSFVAVLLIMAMWPSPARFGAPSNAVAVQEDAHAISESEDHSNTATSSVLSNSDVERLLKKTAEVNYDNVPLSEVMHKLKSVLPSVNIQLDQSAKDDSLSEDTPITFAMKGVRLSTTLRLMLREHNATYLIDDGVLVIISLDVACEPQFQRQKVNNVADLLQNLAENDSGVVQHTQFLRTRRELLYLSGKTGNEHKNTDVSNHEPLKAPDALLNLIKETVTPEGWDDTNGDATIQMLSGLMVVVNTEEALEEIDELLTNLRRNIGDEEDATQRPPSSGVEDLLDKPTDLAFDSVPFSEVMNELRDSYQLKIYLDESAKNDALTEDDSITFAMKHTRLSTMLRLMLSERNATYAIDDGVLIIISHDVAGDPQFHRKKVFNVGDLKQHFTQHDALGRLNENRQTVEKETETNQVSEQEVANDSLYDLIKGTVAPDDWDDTNGDGTVSIISNLMVVTQSESALEEIEDLLDDLRQNIK